MAEEARLRAINQLVPAVVIGVELSGVEFEGYIPLSYVTVEVRPMDKAPYQVVVNKLGYPPAVGNEIMVYSDPNDASKIAIQ